jgi:AcrR family transcriptional regulator
MAPESGNDLASEVGGEVDGGIDVPKRRVRARRGEGDRLRDEILDAAEQLLIKSADPEAVSIRAISQIVGVSAPSIYRHFEDKDALLLAACERGYERFSEYIGKEAANASDPLFGIKSLAHAYVRFAEANPGHYRVLFMTPGMHAHPNEVHDHGFSADLSGMKGLEFLIEEVEACVEQGLIQLLSSAEDTATMLWSFVHGMASIRIAQPDLAFPDVHDQVDRMFVILANGMCTDLAKDRMAAGAMASPTKRVTRAK